MMQEGKLFKILAVDDNPKNIQVIGNILREANYNVGFATDGQQALNLLLKSNDYDLVLLDIDMPIMNGFDTCKTMRTIDSLKEIPVIFLTAMNEVEYILQGFDIGAQDYITKPFNAKELLSRVKTHLDLKYNKDQLKKVNIWLEEKVKERTQALRQANEELQEQTVKLQQTLTQLEDANKHLALLDDAKADFLRIISHEINTPLNGIIGFTNILMEELKSSAFFDLIKYLETSALRLDRFSKISLLITELRTNSTFFINEEVSVDKLVDFVQKKLSGQVLSKNIQLKLPELNNNIVLLGNQNLLEICFESILDNAIKFSSNDSEISLLINRTDSEIICTFIDQGCGFSPESLDNLFTLFSSGKHHTDQNLGLDLALVKLIMDAHQGSIEVQNNNYGGATVKLTFTLILK
jgi:two-component system sensor histidine kinase/response regulator